MNRLVSLLSLVMLLSAATFSANAQVREANMSMSRGNNNALVLQLPNSDAKTVTKSWDDYIKKYKGKTKFDKKSNEYFTDDATIKEMSANTVDIYASFRQVGTATEMVIWFDLGGAFLNSQMHREGYPSGEKIVYEFALTVSKGMVEDELKEEQKKLGKLQDDMKSLEKDKAGFEKDIESAKKAIAQAEKEIEEAKLKINQNAQAQSNKKGEIEAQGNVVKTVEKKLKDLE